MCDKDIRHLSNAAGRQSAAVPRWGRSDAGHKKETVKLKPSPGLSLVSEFPRKSVLKRMIKRFSAKINISCCCMTWPTLASADVGFQERFKPLNTKGLSFALWRFHVLSGTGVTLKESLQDKTTLTGRFFLKEKVTFQTSGEDATCLPCIRISAKGTEFSEQGFL